MQKLREELLTVYPDPGDPPSLPVLEQLPYLTAVIYECMKMLYNSFPPFNRISFSFDLFAFIILL